MASGDWDSSFQLPEKEKHEAMMPDLDLLENRPNNQVQTQYRYKYTNIKSVGGTSSIISPHAQVKNRGYTNPDSTKLVASGAEQESESN